ncbi:glycosyltransferase family 4 protein [Photobacterium damselae]|uniref:Glycosyltransferase family 4 protein n=1 Tax=Photobacterium damselae subsp. damselae TaxID=85581 RepID=A0AAD3X0F4_PHODD|nr:glycosyltransferase family 4 protein [Photobacterium damselae]KAB1183218.1 glycosyltransferase family 4 protein [Photobacterium damselae subsp. damselae]
MKKKIIITSNAYWPSIGGIENSLRHLVLESKSMNDHVDVIVSDIGTPHFKQVEHIDGVNIFRYQLRPTNSSILNFIKSNIDAYNLFKAKFKKNPNSIIIARFHLSVIYAHLVGFRNIKYLVPSIVRNQCNQEINNINLKQKIKKKIWVLLHDFLQKKALKLSDVFVFSDTMKEQCNDLVDCLNIRITKPGVDTDRFYPDEIFLQQEREKYTISYNEKVILFVGRFVQAKQVDLLIKSFSLLREGKLILVGDGDEKNNLIQLIYELNLNDRVIIIPPCRNVEDIYRIADVFVMSSSYEPLGQTIIEAFSSGLPVVAFRRSVLVNTATEELGMDDFIYYAEDFTIDSLSMALSKAIKNNLNRNLIHNTTKDKFSWNNLYLTLVGS